QKVAIWKCRDRLAVFVVLNEEGEATWLRPVRCKGGAMAGKPVHIEFPAGDTARARQFWGSLYGWQFQDIEGPIEYHMAQIVPNETGGAVFPADGDNRGLRVYFDVDDINAGAARENGRLLTEEVMGLEGFTGNESILYHLQSPCRVKELGAFTPIEREEWVPETHAHRRMNTYDVEPEGDEISGRRTLMWNSDVEI